MIQCVVCEDWLHAGHLDARVPNHDRYSEMICGPCAEANSFLKDYFVNAVNPDDEDNNTLNETVNVTSFDDTLDTSIPVIQSVVSTSKELDSQQIPTDAISTIVTKNENLECSAGLGDTEMNNEKKDTSVGQIEPDTLSVENIEKQTQNNTNNDCPMNTDQNNDLKNSATDNDNNGIVQDPTLFSESNGNILENAISNINIENIPIETNDSGNLTSIKEKNLITEQETLIEKEFSTESNINNTENNPTLSGEQNSNTELLNIETNKTNVNIDNILEPNLSEDNLNDIFSSELNELKDEAVTSLKMLENDNDICHLENVINAVQTFQSENIEKVDSSNIFESAKNSESTNSSDNILKSSNENEISSSVSNENEPDLSISKMDVKLNSDIENEELIDNTETESILAEKESISAEKESVSAEKDSISTQEAMEIDSIQKSGINDDNKQENAVEFEQNNTVPESKINEHLKRKIEPSLIKTEPIDDEILTKKQKMDFVKCIRPTNSSQITHKGAIFWPYEWRTKLCTCLTCSEMYKEKNVSFLLDTEDTVIAYENLGKSKTSSSQYEKGLEALSSLDRIQQINAITEYNKMKEKLLEFLKTFKDKREVVREEDIKGFFAGMKPKREPDGVYFCR